MLKFIKHNSLHPFPLEKDSIDAVITSPPYFNLRTYQGDPDMIGMEKTLGEYIEHIVAVAKNIKGVLKPEGSFMLNLGDSYFDKCLSLVPHRVAIALISDGWILRNTIVWHKPNPTPSSVKDRLNTSHEYIFHFVLNQKYYYNLDAIRVAHQTINITKNMSNPNLVNKINGLKIEVAKEVGSLFEESAELDKETNEYKTGYKNSKLQGETDKNIGARGGFAVTGETLENRYHDGGKNPNDVFVDEGKFTLEDELQAERDGYSRHAAARVLGRLRKGLATNHPLGKNPADVFMSNSTTENSQRKSPDEVLLDLETECPDCGLQFRTDLENFFENPGDVWMVNTESSKIKHCAMWPTKLVKRMILATVPVGGTVLDIFSGSGTTAIMAEKLERNGVGFDIGYDEAREQRIAKGIQNELIIE
jgi:DNA modification methylase